MKFIRDIIGEKRQSQSEGNVAEASRYPETPIFEEREVTRPVAEPEPDNLFDDMSDVADDIAAFFAKEEADSRRVDLPRSEMPLPETALRTTYAPTRLVPGPVARGCSMPETKYDADMGRDAALEDVAQHDVTQDIDRVLLGEHDADDTLEATIRAARQMTTPRPALDAGSRFEHAYDRDQPLRKEPPATPAAFELPEAWRHRDAERSEPAPVAAPEPEPAPVLSMAVPQPAMGRGEARHGRVKTRLLGFSSSADTAIDPLANQQEAKPAPFTSFPVGWLIVVEGAGRGSAFSLFSGVSTIGRGEDQTVRLDFGDNSISRENHASIAYDPTQKGFFIGHGGKANLVRRNNRPVLSTEELVAGDRVTIGETVLRFVPLCGPDFSWDGPAQGG